MIGVGAETVHQPTPIAKLIEEPVGVSSDHHSKYAIKKRNELIRFTLSNQTSVKVSREPT
jgi:hypothetical protein